jgi:hypothetical protein
MSEKRKNPGLPFWVTVALVAVLVLYPLSFGPACWIASRTEWLRPTVPIVYKPMTFIVDIGPQRLDDFVWWYSNLYSADHWYFTSWKDPRDSSRYWELTRIEGYQ